jgi:hypothetical protein
MSSGTFLLKLSTVMGFEYFQHTNRSAQQSISTPTNQHTNQSVHQPISTPTNQHTN